MNHTAIEWTHRPETGGAAGGFTWNPIRARNKETGKVGTFCTHASPGCLHCYAEAIGKRFGTGLDFNVPNLEKVEFFIDEKILAEPLKRKKPATIFVGDMFDLFHEAIWDTHIRHVLWTIAQAKQHTFQILTKRTDRMLAIFKEIADCAELGDWTYTEPGGAPLRNLWLGTSVESQKYADERIPLLLQTPAAVRFLSVEPMLEAVDLEKPFDEEGLRPPITEIDWIICGGESGPGARPFNLAWAESLQEQCKAAGVAFFMKQVGSFPGTGPMDKFSLLEGEDSKGGDMMEWPAHLRVRQFPSVEKLVTA